MRATSIRVSFVLALCALLSAWYWWQAGRPATLADAPGARLACASYAPFYRDGYTPFDSRAATREQIDADLALLAQRFACVRTYEVGHGLHETARLAEKHGLKVLLGIWIGSDAAANERELALGIETARQNASSIRALIVGSEVLLRGEQSPAGLRRYIERVRTAVPQVPATYADVWEFWLRHAELADAVSFVTVHILPYWEDRPVPLEHAVDHVVAIYRHVADTLKGREIFLGETGWPSYGRQRHGAKPGAIAQAHFTREFATRAAREEIPYNLIEAFDQHWKRGQEGAVGGYWGLYDRYAQAKFPFRGPLAEAPLWSLAALALAGALCVVVVFDRRRTRRGEILPLLSVAIGGAGANLAFWRDMWMTNRNGVEWAATGAYALLLVAATVLLGRAVAAWCATGTLPPRMAPANALLSKDDRYATVERSLGALRLAFLYGAATVSLLLVFDARYRDFPLALYVVPAVGFALLAWIDRRDVRLGWAEILPAGAIALAAPWIAVAEHLATSTHGPWSLAQTINPQALTWAGLSLLLAGSVLLPAALERRARHRPRPAR